MSMRYKPRGDVAGDCPPVAAARILWLSLEQFERKLPELVKRGFPPPDPTTGMFDMDAINAWRKQRNKQLFQSSDLTPVTPARNADDVVRLRLTGGRGG